MKVVVLGGYGVFGAHLVRLLVRDGHSVVVAGRRGTPALALAADVGATHLVVDRAGGLDALFALKPDVVVDAAGPFHAYGADPYRLASACITHGVNYLDLADDPAFCAGIAVLDSAAKDAGVFVLSGVSSVPAISSAVVAALADGSREIDTISTAILPGNRAPRGRSVVESILHQCGMDIPVCVDGTWQKRRSWSAPVVFDLGQGIVRRGWMIAVPDQQLFPQAFDARTVFFRAGMELGVMNHALAVFSWLRGKTGVGVPRWLVTAVMWLADRLAPFGTDVGGMSVAVTAKMQNGWQRKTWRMVVRKGDGPAIPAVAARSVLRVPEQIAKGARPAIAEVPLALITDAMADLAVTTETAVADVTPLFQAHLGDGFDDLPDAVQEGHAVHGPRHLQGRASVKRGTSYWPRFLAAVFRFPPAALDVPVTVTMTPQNGGELWERRFDGRPFWSFLKVRKGVMTERFGPLTFTIGLHVADGQLFYPVEAGRLGPIPLPKFLLPISTAREYAADGRFHFDVELRAPFTGALMVHYQGWLEPVSSRLCD